jgi:CubicO group peptidase (beta-lactamase class C family)
VLDDPARPGAETTSFYWPFAARDPTYGIEDANNPDNTCLQGAAALLSTPSDVVRFGAAMLDGRLIRAGTLDMLRTPLEIESGESTGYGLGWFVRSAPLGPGANTTIFGHGGSSAGGFTSFMTLPEHGIVVAVTTNVSMVRNLPSLSLRLAHIFAGVEADAWQSLRGEDAPVHDFRPLAW